MTYKEKNNKESQIDCDLQKKLFIVQKMFGKNHPLEYSQMGVNKFGY